MYHLIKMKLKIFLALGIFLLLGILASANDLGCCVNEIEGLCDLNSAKDNCEENGGNWFEDERCNILECQKKCCVIGESISLVTETRCRLEASRIGFEFENIGLIFQNPDSNGSCGFLMDETKLGACVYERLEEGEVKKDCNFFSEFECINSNGEFYEGYLCSHPDLNTSCERQVTTECIRNLDEVYWIDSCGNRENIYDSDKDRSWNNGMILSKSESCGSGSENSNSPTCGNCDYELGTKCEKYNPIEDTKPVYGEYVCKSMNCAFDENIPGMKRERLHGESWCVYEGHISWGQDTPGSRHWLFSCFNGEINSDGCADYRMELCAQKEEVAVGGVHKTEAFCRVNTWDYCINANFGRECDEECKSMCNANSDCMVAVLDELFGLANGTEILVGKELCVPKYPPGFSNEKWNEKWLGSIIEALAYEYLFGWLIDEVGGLILGEFGGLITDEVNGYINNINDAKSVSSTRICGLATTDCMDDLCGYNPGFSIGVNNLGIKLGDCGSYTNMDGKISTATGNLILSNEIEMILIQYIGLIADVLISKGKYAETPDAYDYPDPEPLKGEYSEANSDIIRSVENIITSLILGDSEITEIEELEGDIKVKHILLPWRPILINGGKYCNQCSANPYFECTEYRCKSLGWNCEYKTNDQGKGYCKEEIDEEEETEKLEISELQKAGLPKEGHSYNEISENGYNVRKDDGSCLRPFEGVSFGIKTNVEASCRISLENVGYDNMTEVFTIGGKLPGKEFIKTKLVPSPSSIIDNPNSSIFNENNEIIFYIKCKKNNGEESEETYTVNICVSDEDEVPPTFVIASPKNNSIISNETKFQEVLAILSEPANCRWGFGKPEKENLIEIYNSLEDEMNCSTRASFSDFPIYNCNAKLPIDSLVNNFYFLCKDQPWLRESDERNVGATNTGIYEYVLSVNTEKLEIESIEPKGEIITQTKETTVDVKVITKGGAGEIRCLGALVNEEIGVELKSDGTEHEIIIPKAEGVALIAGSIVNGTEHKGRVYLEEGKYELEIFCIDTITGDNITKSGNFSIEYKEWEFEDFIEDCEELYAEEKYNCYTEYAIAEKNETYCLAITNENYLNNCYYLVAEVKEEKQICLKIKDSYVKDGCYANIAIIKKDSSICQSIEDNEVKERCIREST